MTRGELFTYEYYTKIADYLFGEIGDFRPEIGMILGSGLNNYAKRIDVCKEIMYKDIPGFLISTAPGHEGKLIFGTVEGRKVVLMSGRFHSYEGYEFEQLAIPVRVLKILGIKTLVVTNASGAVNTDYQVGDVVIMTDHIKFNGASPLRGPNIDEFGPRFFDMSHVYDKDLAAIAEEVGKTSELNVHKGVYFFTPGPNFETPAEIRAIRVLGGDIVGMSTVTEVLTAAQCGLPVLGLSLVCNMASGVLEEALSGEDVINAANKVAPLLEKYFTEVLRRLP